LLSGVARVLPRAVRAAAARSTQVREQWRRRLAEITRDPGELQALSELRILARVADVRAAHPESFRIALERQGEALAGRGVPEDHALAALALQLESVLADLAAARRPPAELTALVRLWLVAGLAISAGYTAARAASRGSFGERERQRLSRDLHDEIGHHLVVLKLYLEMIRRDLEQGSVGGTRAKLDEATALVVQAVQAVRRLILDLGPAVLEEVGFFPALRLYARQFSERTGVRVQVQESGVPERLGPELETALYRVLQGALSNVIKHAHAKQVRITLGRVKRVLVLVIEDDGVGFDPAAPRRSFGLEAMRERIEGLGGRFHLESRGGRPGRRGPGTRIEIDVPLGEEAS
jgi:signal transduction histidine kinase